MQENAPTVSKFSKERVKDWVQRNTKIKF